MKTLFMRLYSVFLCVCFGSAFVTVSFYFITYWSNILFVSLYFLEVVGLGNPLNEHFFENGGTTAV